MESICTKFLAAMAAIALCAPAMWAKTYSVASPDKCITVTVDNSDGRLTYDVVRDGKILVNPSPISLDIVDGPKDITIKSARKKGDIEETIDAPFYRQKQFSIVYNELDLKLNGDRGVTFRVFDDGVAYRFYTSSKKDELIVDDETVQVNLPSDLTLFIPYCNSDKTPMAMSFQNIYDITPASKAEDKLAFLPATVDYGNGLKLTLLESDMESFPGTFVTVDKNNLSIKSVHAKYPLKYDFHKRRYQEYVTERESYIAKTVGTRTFPWRILAITTDDTQMPVNNLVYALASPSRVADTSWIRPGKVAWDWWNNWGLKNVPFKAGINNDTYKYFIDFAAQNGIEYVVLDEGWFDSKKNDMLTTVPEIDLPELIAYGKSKGVDLVLWTIYNVLDNQLEEACKKYSDMGIAGFKVDFLDRDDQPAVERTYRIADAAARHNLFLDYHGIYKPTGINRTYPNVINFEGLFGMEEVKWTKIEKNMPLYDVIFPYIRMMSGPVDYTPGAMRNANKKDWQAIYNHPISMGTRSHQLATYIVHDSPFTMLCDAPTNYIGEEECVDFITGLPTVFDETKIIDGRLGEFIVTARRAGDSWFIGGLTNWNPRELQFDLSFLPTGRHYNAVIMKDGINCDRNAEDYSKSEVEVDSSTTMKINLASGGGFAIRIDPK
ncbi:MAG: glycoside hydrolase family 97 protein [Muribaculum sp.]|nr:glycoside hydrolase family 97 protein [Muribaculum sp.]